MEKITDMENILKLKCPNCGGRLSVKLRTQNPEVNIPCPICKISSSLKSYIQITEQKEQEHTEYPQEDKTQVGTQVANYVIGQLKVQKSALSPLALKMGRNIIGRKAKSSTADIQIPLLLNGRSRMSREHLIVDVDKVPGRGIIHFLSLYKSGVNDTYLNGVKLSCVDRIILKQGDVITLPEVELVFEIPDEEGTVI